MALTRDFEETIRARVQRDPQFRKNLLHEGIESMPSGDIATAKTLKRAREVSVEPILKNADHWKSAGFSNAH